MRLLRRFAPRNDTKLLQILNDFLRRGLPPAMASTTDPAFRALPQAKPFHLVMPLGMAHNEPSSFHFNCGKHCFKKSPGL